MTVCIIISLCIICLITQHLVMPYNNAPPPPPTLQIVWSFHWFFTLHCLTIMSRYLVVWLSHTMMTLRVKGVMYHEKSMALFPHSRTWYWFDVTFLTGGGGGGHYHGLMILSGFLRASSYSKYSGHHCPNALTHKELWVLISAVHVSEKKTITIYLMVFFLHFWS